MTTPRRQLAAYLFLCVVVAFSFWVDHQQDIDRCRERNEATRESVLIGAEALSETFPDADPDRVSSYFANLNRRLDAAEADCT